MNWVHLHLALNHIPVLGTLFISLLLVVALVKNSNELKRLSLAAFVILMILAIPIKFTGDFAYEVVASQQWMVESLAKQHEQAADQATSAVFVLGLVAAISLFVTRKQRSLSNRICLGVFVLALFTFLLMARTANLGGQLRHYEIRSRLPYQKPHLGIRTCCLARQSHAVFGKLALLQPATPHRSVN